MTPMGRHVLEVAGSRVTIVDGEVVDITEPRTVSCPLRSRVYGIERETRESIRESMEFYIGEWGMFTSNRVVRTEELPISFGITEIFNSCMRRGLIDAVVMVCEGAGTVIADAPDVVQGIGAHMTGLIETSPEPGIIAKLEENGVHVLKPDGATMDQHLGATRAIEMGYRRIGVTVSGHDSLDAKRIRDELGEVIAIAAVHNTGVSERDAERIASSCDIATSCASRWVRDRVGPRALMQLGMHIPVFILTPLGKELAMARLADFEGPLIVGTGKIPALKKEQPHPLR